MARRRAVVFLLCVSVLAPLVLYTDRLSILTTASNSRDEYSNDEILNLEVNDTITEPIGEAYVDKLDNYEHNLDKQSDDEPSKSDAKVNGELQFAEPIEHRNRVLSAAVDIDNSAEKDSIIKKVTDANVEKDILEVRGVMGENNSLSLQHAVLDSNTKNEEREFEGETKQSSIKNERQTQSKAHGDRTTSQGISNTRVRKLRDQLIQAKVYLNLGATKANPQFLRELRQHVREVQRTLGEATKDSELPRNAGEKIRAMERTLAKGQTVQDECSNVVQKLRATIHSTEEQLQVQNKQTVFLTQLAAKTLPKGLHCLPLRLATEYFSLESKKQHFPNQEKIEDPKLCHYALFSDNVLATAVVVNSTESNTKHPADHVFHIVTDKLNYAAMRMWFLANPPRKATVQVQNIEEFKWLNESYSPVLKQLGSQSMIEYYFRTQQANSDANLKYRNPKYLSILNHLRFYLPELFPKLDKVVFLDDDIVVQKDLSALWKIDMKGKVNGAVQTCRESFHRYDRYLNFSNPLIANNFDPRACGWAYGMNVFDLSEWRKQKITEVYHYWQNKNEDRQLWKLGTLPPGLITFYNTTFHLDRAWHVLGLGYNPHVNQRDIERAAVVHYNGNMKPWLEIGMSKYRGYWSKYVKYDDKFVQECNINP